MQKLMRRVEYRKSAGAGVPIPAREQRAAGMEYVDEYQDFGSYRPRDRANCVGLCVDSVGSPRYDTGISIQYGSGAPNLGGGIALNAAAGFVHGIAQARPHPFLNSIFGAPLTARPSSQVAWGCGLPVNRCPAPDLFVGRGRPDVRDGER
jgi:hypothetical protein